MAEKLNEDKLAAVVIGRNEGKRLINCLQVLTRQLDRVVYVDSGSSDDSITEAKRIGVDVVELDSSQAFTAARARNEGFARVIEANATITYLQFIDGDCELDQNWLETAVDYLDQHGDVAIVCGRRRERYPRASIYNQLCDFEWDTTAGETSSCGGDALVRINSFAAVGGFREDLVAGEEPELCLRLRRAGWKIWRLEREMTTHDANMTTFLQWWKRSLRSGFTYAQGVHELGRDCTRERNRALFWGGVLPILTLGLLFWRLEAMLILLAYPIQVFQITLRSKRALAPALLDSTFLTIGKLPEMIGVMKYYGNRLLGITDRLIEYK